MSHHLRHTIAACVGVCGLAIVAGPFGAVAAAQGTMIPARAADSQVREVAVQAALLQTEVAFRLPPGATVRDESSRRAGTVTLDITGAGVAGTVSRAVGVGGVTSIAASEGSDSTARLTIRVADLRRYRVAMDPIIASPTDAQGTRVRIILDGTGEETPAKMISLVPERVAEYDKAVESANAARARLASYGPTQTSAAPGAPMRTRGGRELMDDESISADSATSALLHGWERTAVSVPTLSYPGTPLPDALAGLAKLSGRSIVAGLGTDTITVSGNYNNATWPAVLKSMARVYGLKILVSSDSVITVEQTNSIAEIEQTIPLETRAFHITYVTPVEKMVAALQPHLTKGRGTISAIGTRGDLLVRDTPDALERMADMLRKVDRPDRQYRVSAVIVAMSQNDARDLGFTTDAAQRGGNSVGGLPIPLAGQGGSTTGQGSGGTGIYPPGVQSGDPNFYNVRRGAAGVGGAFTPTRVASPAVKLLLSTITGRYSVATFIEALEQSGIARVVSRQTGFVREGETFSSNSGERTPLRTQGFGPTQPGQGVVGGVGSTPNANSGFGNGQGNQIAAGPGAAVGLEETGTKLSVTARAVSDSMIGLDVDVEQSTAVPSGLGDAGVQFKVNHYASKFYAHDGETKVIGGLQDAMETRTQSGVPYLSNIPIFGHLFSSTSQSKTSRVLVVLVTATTED
ncbi:MAG: secretin N-terminal domain-containing protein [Gemmatimonadaceae bacterium]